VSNKKQNIQSLIENESDVNLNNLLPKEDVNIFKDMVGELKDTWTKKQVFRTETEARISVLQDLNYPTKASKYWQCVREQNVFLENLMTLSFEYRRNDIKIKRLQNKIKEEQDELKKELWKVDLDEKTYSKANMELIAQDRMREIKMWSKLKKELNDGSFNTKDVNQHQLESYDKILTNKVNTISSATTQPEIFNAVGQLQTIKRVKKEKELQYNNKEKITFGKQKP